MNVNDYRTTFGETIRQIWKDLEMARPYDIHFTEPGDDPRQDMIARKAPNQHGISGNGDPSQYVKAHGNVIVSRDAAAAYVTIETNDEYVVASGGAKRNKGDTFDFEIGANLAIGRALKAAGEEFERRAWEKVAPPRVIPKGEWTIHFVDAVDSDGRDVFRLIGNGFEKDGYVETPDEPTRRGIGKFNVGESPWSEPVPTLAELEDEEAEEVYRASIDRTDPDAEGNWPSGGTEGYEKRLSLFDYIMRRWT